MRRFLATLTLSTLLVGALAGCAGGTRGQPVGGIHARLAYSEGGGLRVVDAPAGGAADLSGIQADDIILSIDGESLRSMPYADIVDRLRGPIGSSVELDVFRDAEVLTLVVVRQAYR
ncbi:MAG: PDZ domain-containing protein [Polyangiales bacterium]